MSQITERIHNIIAPTLDDMGYDIVRIKIQDQSRGQTLQIMAERQQDGLLDVDNCTEISEAVSALLDIEDPIPGAYDLEISSPGLDRPLTRLKDFENYAGYEAKITLAQPDETGQKKFRGYLVSVEGEDVKIFTEQGECVFPFADIQSAKLILTDELLKSAQQ